KPAGMRARKLSQAVLSGAGPGPYNRLSKRVPMRFLPLAASLALAWLSCGAAPPPKSLPKATPAPVKAAPAPGGQVKGDPYSVTVPVDATAAAASVAQNNAINGGRARAWAALSHRLVPQKDWGK